MSSQSSSISKWRQGVSLPSTLTEIPSRPAPQPRVTPRLRLEKNRWPNSDLEMFNTTPSIYLDQQPFSVYYMTVSGHARYNNVGNAMGKKNFDAVSHLDCSRTVQCYLATQLELEYALEYLVAQLEAAGIADDTVIVLATDHYPYALAKSSTWDNAEDYLAELYGFKYANKAERDHG